MDQSITPKPEPSDESPGQGEPDTTVDLAQAEKPQLSDTVQINDLTTFVTVLTAWHAQKVAIVEKMLTIPEGTLMQVDSGPDLILTGDLLVGFQAGLSVALGELGILPFISTTESSDTTTVPADANKQH